MCVCAGRGGESASESRCARARARWRERERRRDGDFCNQNPNQNGARASVSKHAIFMRGTSCARFCQTHFTHLDHFGTRKAERQIGPGHPQHLFVRPLCAVSKLVRHLCHSSASDRGVSCTVTEVSHLLTDTGVAHTPVRHPDTVRGVSLAYTK